MRSLFVALCLSLLVAPACQRTPYSRSDSGFSAVDKKTFYDFRSPQQGMGASLDAAATRKILSAIFPSHLSDSRQCGKSGASQSAVAPTILGSAEGSFTAAGLKQVVYLIDVGECGQRAITRRLVVFTGDTATANVDAPITSKILRTSDLDNDGKNELLLYGEGPPGQEVIGTTTLVAFDKDKLFTFEDFGSVYDSTCAADFPGRALRASAINYLPPPAGQKPRFTVELYRAPCPAQGQLPQWSQVVAGLK